MGRSGIGKSTVPKPGRDIDERGQAFLDRPLVGDWPCPWLDAAHPKQRKGGRIVSVFAVRSAELGTFLDASGHDAPARRGVPAQHRRKLHSTNAAERLNKAAKRRADVVGIFPGEASILRLIGAVLLEANNEWTTPHRCMQVKAMDELLGPPLIERKATPADNAEVTPRAA